MPEGIPIGENGSEPVLVVTDLAREKIAAILDSQGAPSRTIRVSASAPGKFAMNLEPEGKPRLDDAVLDFERFQVFIDSQSRPLVEGATLNWLDTYTGGGFQFTPAAPKIARKQAPEGAEGDVWRRIEQILEEEINPAVASHGGYINLVDYREGVAYLEMGGGCQGCAMSKMTLRQGVERMLRAQIPEIREIQDVTDHAGGVNPYYANA